ncbi:hypothetical protein Aduo_012857 [Ancylostoma duodenale]
MLVCAGTDLRVIKSIDYRFFFKTQKSDVRELIDANSENGNCRAQVVIPAVEYADIHFNTHDTQEMSHVERD